MADTVGKVSILSLVSIHIQSSALPRAYVYRLIRLHVSPMFAQLHAILHLHTLLSIHIVYLLAAITVQSENESKANCYVILVK